VYFPPRQLVVVVLDSEDLPMIESGGGGGAGAYADAFRRELPRPFDCPRCGCHACNGCYCHEDIDHDQLAAIISPEKFRMLADWFDADDALKGKTGDEVQRDLRRFADALEGGKP
jgi:hypothetical protein